MWVDIWGKRSTMEMLQHLKIIYLHICNLISTEGVHICVIFSWSRRPFAFSKIFISYFHSWHPYLCYSILEDVHFHFQRYLNLFPQLTTIFVLFYPWRRTFPFSKISLSLADSTLRYSDILYKYSIQLCQRSKRHFLHFDTFQKILLFSLSLS